MSDSFTVMSFTGPEGYGQSRIHMPIGLDIGAQTPE